MGQISILSADADAITIGGVIHFAPVETASKPLAEAAYLEKSNNLRLIHGKLNFDDSNSSLNIAQMEFYVPSAMLYIAPHYLYFSASGDGESSSFNTYGLSLGITPLAGLRVSTAWTDEIDYEFNFDVKYVANLRNNNAINIELSYAKSEDDEFEEEDDYFGIKLDYFLDQTLSIGIEYNSTSNFNQAIADATLINGEDAYGIRTEKYFSNALSLFAKYSTSDEIDNWAIGASYRFLLKIHQPKKGRIRGLFLHFSATLNSRHPR